MMCSVHRDPWWSCMGCWERMVAVVIALFFLFSFAADFLWGSR